MWRMAKFIRHICGEQKILLDIAIMDRCYNDLVIFVNAKNAILRHGPEVTRCNGAAAVDKGE